VYFWLPSVFSTWTEIVTLTNVWCRVFVVVSLEEPWKHAHSFFYQTGQNSFVPFSFSVGDFLLAFKIPMANRLLTHCVGVYPIDQL
jgi:hypothetical protein